MKSFIRVLSVKYFHCVFLVKAQQCQAPGILPKRLATVHKPKEFTWSKIYHLFIHRILTEHHYVPHSVLALGTQHWTTQTRILANTWPPGLAGCVGGCPQWGRVLHRECHNSFLPLLQAQRATLSRQMPPPLTNCSKTRTVFWGPWRSPLLQADGKPMPPSWVCSHCHVP